MTALLNLIESKQDLQHDPRSKSRKSEADPPLASGPSKGSNLHHDQRMPSALAYLPDNPIPRKSEIKQTSSVPVRSGLFGLS